MFGIEIAIWLYYQLRLRVEGSNHTKRFLKESSLWNLFGRYSNIRYNINYTEQ